MDKLIYDDELHTYKLNGEFVPSVTQIASDICGIKSQFFTPGSAARGTAIHSELAKYYDPSIDFVAADFTIDEAAALALYVKPNLNMMSEVMVYNEQLNYAGTCDLVEIEGEKVKRLIDFKSGDVNKKYCTIQLSLYKLALESMGYDVSACWTAIVSPKGITVIDAVSWEDCWNMQKAELDPSTNDIEIIQERMKELAPAVAEYQQLESDLRSILLEQMESAGATQYTGSLFTALYVKPTTRVSFDGSRFQKEHPELYEQYLKTTQIRSSIRLSTNELKDETNVSEN